MDLRRSEVLLVVLLISLVLAYFTWLYFIAPVG